MSPAYDAIACFRLYRGDLDHLRQLAAVASSRLGRKVTWADLNRQIIHQFVQGNQLVPTPISDLTDANAEERESETLLGALGPVT